MELNDELQRDYYPQPASPPNVFHPERMWLWGAVVAALLGALFSALSTIDFIEHLDRQVHSIHCSFIPGASQHIGETGCRTVMLSPYSSLFRESLWGGLPISLLSLAVFAYLVYRSADFALKATTTKKETRFLLAGAFLPVLMSLLYGIISMAKIGTFCRLCGAIYICSAACFLCALIAHTKASEMQRLEPTTSIYARWFGEGVLYVAVLAVLYLAFAPTAEKSAEGCGALVSKKDPSKILVPIGKRGGTTSIAVLDPLCPACLSFEQRIEASSFLDKIELNVLLFPLDSECNWMVKESLHPGACAVSEAVLCDRDNAKQIITWALQNQEYLRQEAKTNKRSFRKLLTKQFPQVKGCIGRPKIRNRLNRSLRWAVRNALPVLTPQLFVGDRRVCDEDTDLGLEYTVASMLEKGGKR